MSDHKIKTIIYRGDLPLFLYSRNKWVIGKPRKGLEKIKGVSNAFSFDECDWLMLNVDPFKHIIYLADLEDNTKKKGQLYIVSATDYTLGKLYVDNVRKYLEEKEPQTKYLSESSNYHTTCFSFNQIVSYLERYFKQKIKERYPIHI